MRWAVALSALWLGGCFGSPNDQPSVSLAERQDQSGQCPQPLLAGASSGNGCPTAAACAEVCCACPDGGYTYAAQACVAEACDVAQDACARALGDKPALCQ